MRWASLLSLPLLASAALVQRDIVKRDAATDINTAVGYIASNITQLDSSVNGLGYNDTIGAIFILFQTIDLQNAVKNAETVVSNSPVLTEAESGAVAVPVVQLVNQVKGLLSDLVAKKPEFQDAILGYSADWIVEYNLQQSQQTTDAFGKAFASKLYSTYATLAPTIIGQIDSAFQAAIAAFSN